MKSRSDPQPFRRNPRHEPVHVKAQVRADFRQMLFRQSFDEFEKIFVYRRFASRDENMTFSVEGMDPVPYLFPFSGRNPHIRFRGVLPDSAVGTAVVAGITEIPPECRHPVIPEKAFIDTFYKIALLNPNSFPSCRLPLITYHCPLV